MHINSSLYKYCLSACRAAAVVMLCSRLEAGVIFSEDFDQQPDWAPSVKDERCPYHGHPSCNNLPLNWDFFHTHDDWFPGEVAGAEPTAQISAQQSRSGANGKALVIWDESNGSSGDWGSGGQISKDLGKEYPELYVEFYVKFQPGYRWQSVEAGSGQSLMKLFRAMHFDGGPGESAFGYFKTGFSAPIYILDLSVYTMSATSSVVKAKSAIRCDEQATNYFCGSYNESQSDALPNRPSFADSIGDGQWHKYAVQLVMNSAPGVGDGVVRVWIDDNLLTERTDVPFRGADSNGVTGWNTIGFGGNAHNIPEPDSAQFEQWYAIDDIKVYDSSPNAPSAIGEINATVNK